MISIKKILPTAPSMKAPAPKNKNYPKEEQKPVNLNDSPHYKVAVPISAARKCLSKFLSEYGTLKSSTYCAVEAEHAKLNNCSDDDVINMQKVGREINKKIKKLRTSMWSQNFASYEDYVRTLSEYVKKNGAYINCNEAANLVQYLLMKDGIKSDMVFMYTVDKNGYRTNKVEHVFCLIGLDKNANIHDASTWNASCAICDPWANIAMNARDGIKFYKDLFNLDKNKTLSFELIDGLFPKTQK